MKIYLGPYKNWFGPYQLAEKILFWLDKDTDDRVFKFGHFLAHGTFDTEADDHSLFPKNQHETWLYKLLNWIDSKKQRKIKIRIDNYDTWSADSTLALIILPLLKEVKKSKHGAPFVDDVDMPEGQGLRESEAPQKKNEYDADENHFKRWDWVIDEMIWTFEQLQPDYDWEDQYHSGEVEFISKKLADGNYKLLRGPNDTSVFDKEGWQKHNDRIQNGLLLFGKYFRSLWI